MTVRASTSLRALDAVAVAAGALTAAQAMLWIRVIGSAHGNRPETFAHALSVVLAGLAAGLVAGTSLRERLGSGALRFGSVVVALSGVLFYAAMPVGAAIMLHAAAPGRAAFFAGAALASAAMGALVPALCEEIVALGHSRPLAMARVTAALLLGAAAGVGVAGYLLLDLESLEHTILIVALSALGLAQALWLAAPERRRRAGVTVFALAALVALVGHGRLFHAFLERVHFGPGARETRYDVVVHGRAGIVAVTPDARVYGDGLYRGSYSLDADATPTLVGRAFLVPALHRAPRRILQIGLGSGAWTRLLADVRAVDSLTVVEENAGYLEALWRQPAIAGVLDDPRVRLHLDDPRRWLARHPQRRFDVIVANTEWHWSAGATHVLSAEFLQLLKGHLAEGGVAYFNGTGSLDALYTASGVWRHVIRASNYIAASDAPFDQGRDERRAAVLAVTGPDGAPRLRGAQAEQTADAILDQVSGDLAPALHRANDLWNITDDNMASEFKATGAGAWWRALPGRVWRPDRAWPTVLF
ncbi:MAG: hypothetical protein Q8K55_15720 [Gemmatimonadaceae bacterium]|nr:hypothetical protein [Gemmatimonadaceae bacterium]